MTSRVASVSPRSGRLRPRCVTRFSRRRASASEGCPSGTWPDLKSNVTRRDFVATGAGLVISFSLARHRAAAASSKVDFAPNAWLRIGSDGIVTLTVDKSEMEQGSQPGLAMILAEELEADWSSVRLGPLPDKPAGRLRTIRTRGRAANAT